MFENIIGNTNIITIIRNELKKGVFPKAALLYGPPYSGKHSTAFEIARVLSCEKKNAPWSCSCRSCNLHRELLHPHMLLLGSHYFEIEINAAADAFRRTQKAASRFLFTRAVRKLTRRFDPAVWEAEESRRKTVQELVFKIEDALDLINSIKIDSPKIKLLPLLQTVIALTKKLSTFMAKDNIPINQIRNASRWSRLSTQSLNKVIIIENVENMLDSSRNSLLKILEEPPPHVHIILISTKPANIIPTIRSRVRRYKFLTRNKEETKEILQRIFQEKTTEFMHLRDYFLAWQEINLKLIQSLAATFLNKICSKQEENTDILREMQDILSVNTQKETLELFLSELLHLLHKHIRQKCDSATLAAVPLHALEIWAHLLRERYREYSSYRIAPALFLENLYYQMRSLL